MTAATATLTPTMVSPTHTTTLDDIQQPSSASVGTSARKRRRQILQTQRTKSEPVSKKTCLDPEVETTDPSSTMKKKTQMRYDPDIPMTKEEAAAWRRDQRRKRNRESAAASRQRQRDRITELEGEVDEWKEKYEAAMARLQALEDLQGSKPLTVAAPTNPLESKNSQPISPCPSPTLSYVTPSTTSTTSVDSSRQTQGTAMHLIETISRPAVKITGAPSLMSVPELKPDTCMSYVVDNITPNPVSMQAERVTKEEVEFDEFLLDAVEWL